MRKLSIIALFGAVLLSGCGGDSSSILDEGKGSGTGTSSDPVATVTVTSNAASIAADGSTTATITATTKDAKSVLVAGAAVTFTASTGGVLTVASATTGTAGTATATLTAGSGATKGTPITVTVTSGTVTGTVSVAVGIQQTVTLTTSIPQIPSDGSKTATITAYVRNATNQFVQGVSVNFVASSGGVTVTQGTTDVNGMATATLTTAGDPSNRTITVTATAGPSTSTVTVQVIGTKLTVTGPSTLIDGSQGTYTVALVNSGGTGIPNEAVTLTSAKGNTLSAASLTTGANGQNTFTLTGVNAGTDTITATALGLQATQSVSVSDQTFAFTAPTPNTTVNIGTPATVTLQWTVGGVSQTGQVVNFSATRGTLSASSATIGTSGTASVTISSTTAGPSVISATGNGVTTQVAIEFLATTPKVIVLQASPATIATQGQSTITATVNDVNGNLVENAVVDFSLVDTIGGSLSVASAATNAQGQATTVYTASTTTSALDGVQITASVPASTAPEATTSLTVAGSTVFLSLGTGNTITAYSSTQYELPYTVQAVDSAGNGVNGVAVTFTVTGLYYVQGQRVYSTAASFWETVSNTPAPPAPPAAQGDAFRFNGIDACLAGLVSVNGVSTLEPGNVVSTDVGTATTANGGSASVNLIYPKDHAYYVAVALTATATVSGTQNTTTAEFWLPGLAADFSTQTVAPPGPSSPYGTSTTCGVFGSN